MDISVVIPVYNSEEVVAELVRQLDDALSDFDREIILVNDDSRDRSWDNIVDASNLYAHVIGINLRKNSGQDNAIMAGLRYARGAYVVIMDDDLQHSPYDIPALKSACESTNSDVCYAFFAKKKQAVWKNAGSWLNGKVANRMIGKSDEIYLSPFKVVRLEVVKEIAAYDGPFPYVDGLLFMVTQRVTQIEVDHHARFKGRSTYNLFRSIGVFLKLATSFSIYPLRVASVLGFIIAILGFGLGIFYFIDYFYAKDNVPGWTTMVILELLIGGIVLVSLGIIGEYLGRAYLTLNKRPQYTIRAVKPPRDAPK